MKLVGRILLLIAGILFILGGVALAYFSISSLINNLNAGTALTWQYILSFVISILMALFAICAGIGGISYFIGAGPFFHWVAPIAIIILVLWIISFAINLTEFIRNGSDMSLLWSDVLSPLVYVGVPELLYVIGYLLGKRARV
jgi:hypothetical protein